MNGELNDLLTRAKIDSSCHEPLRFRFGFACASRVRHLIENPEVVECLAGLGQFVDGRIDRDSLNALAARAAQLANRHQGSGSIDGCGHAAVSATYAVANALDGKARQAAEYAAYASVYGQGGYGAVSDPESFTPEHAWQVACLRSLLSQQQE